MKTLCIIPCGKTKIWDKYPNQGPTCAKEVYIGPFSTKCKEYAEIFYPDDWCILSAKYGFLFPDDIVPGPYDVSFNSKKSNPISLQDLSKQIKDKNINKYEVLVVLGGKNYNIIIKNILENKKLYFPLEGCKGMGFMMKKLNEQISSENQADQ